MPKVSIIMRVFNEMPYIKYALKMLKKQTFNDFELIIVDSGSTDGSYEVAQQYGADIIYQIEPGSYIPGKVLNEAIAKCSGEVIVFNNSDCIPQNNVWLEKLIQPLLDNKKVVSTFANQIPRVDATPLVRKDYERAFGDGMIHKKWLHFFSLASSAVRKETITDYPFDPKIQYSEDIEWSWRMKNLGKKIIYVPDSIVEHSHNYTLKGLIKRYRGEGKAEMFIYAKPRGNFFRNVIISAGMEILRDIIYLVKHKEYQWIPYAFIVRFLQRYSVWNVKKIKE